VLLRGEFLQDGFVVMLFKTASLNMLLARAFEISPTLSQIWSPSAPSEMADNAAS